MVKCGQEKKCLPGWTTSSRKQSRRKQRCRASRIWIWTTSTFTFPFWFHCCYKYSEKEELETFFGLFTFLRNFRLSCVSTVNFRQWFVYFPHESSTRSISKFGKIRTVLVWKGRESKKKMLRLYWKRVIVKISGHRYKKNKNGAIVC